MDLLPQLQPDPFSALPEDLHSLLWRHIAERLEKGEALITTAQFQGAIEEEYRALTGSESSPELKALLRHAIRSFNQAHPETYVVPGVQNGVNKAFQSGVDKLKWDQLRIEKVGTRSIERFKRRRRVAVFLEEVRVDPGQIDARRCVRAALAHLSTRNGSCAAPAAEALSSDEVAAAREQNDLTRQEIALRRSAQERMCRAIEEREVQKAGRRAEVFVERGLLSRAEAEKLVQLRRIEERRALGEIDAGEANKQRAALLEGGQDQSLDKKLRSAVDPAVHYLQIFAALKRIETRYDEALRFLIRHRGILNRGRPALESALAELAAGREELAQQLIEMMERPGGELRMIAAGLPPYTFVAGRGKEKIGSPLIEESFVDELRRLDENEVSERLNHPHREVRVRPVADMKCLIALLEQLLKPTLLRREIRLLGLQYRIEALYRSAGPEEARRQARDLLRRRLRELFPDLSFSERAAIDERGEALIEAARKKIGQEEGGAQPGARAASPEKAGEDLALTPEEIRAGAQVARIEVRVAGSFRRMPHRIMPDPGDSRRYVLARRHPQSGELVPTLGRNGVRRPVRKERSGLWRLAV